MSIETNTIPQTTDLFDKCRAFMTPRQVRAMGIYPYFQPISSELGDEVVINGQRLVMIGSNNYMGLVNDPRVKEAAVAATMKYGSGCTGSRFLNGTIDLHEELESRLARFLGKEAALVLSTGFQANLATISSLAEKNDLILLDRADHASIVDGCRLSFAKNLKFHHNDMNDLERMLQNATSSGLRGGILIIVDGVFSMEGDIIKLPRLIELAKSYGARVLVDDAHAIGVIGERGAGTASHFGLTDQTDMILGTFSKSFASLGGFVAADTDIIDYIKHIGRALIFSASITPANAAAALCSLDIIEKEPERRENLWKNTRRMSRELQTLGFDIGVSETPIIPIIVGEDMEAFRFCKDLFVAGVFANPIISPATPPGRALIRTSYTATHTDEHLDRALSALESVGKKRGVIH